MSLAFVLLSFNALAQVDVVLWTNQNLHGYIRVYYNDRYVGSITKYYSSPPSPGAPGCVTITVQGKGNTFYGEAQDGTRWYSKPMQLHGSYYTICLKAGNNSRSSSSSSSYSSSRSSSHYDYGYGGADLLLVMGLAVVGVGLYIAGAQSTWDSETRRLDIGVNAGFKSGGLGASVTYRWPKLRGVTAGLGYHMEDKYFYNDYGSYNKNVPIFSGFLGGQLWMFNGWNVEAGLHCLEGTMGWYAMTCTEFNLFRGVGFTGGIGYGRSFKEQSGYPIIDIGLVFRLFAQEEYY